MKTTNMQNKSNKTKAQKTDLQLPAPARGRQMQSSGPITRVENARRKNDGPRHSKPYITSLLFTGHVLQILSGNSPRRQVTN